MDAVRLWGYTMCANRSWVGPVLLAVLSSGAARGGEAIRAPEVTVRDALCKRFDALLAEPGAYAAKVRRQCRGFPEGDLFPYVLPAIAYTNLALADTKVSPRSVERIVALIEAARPAVVRRVQPPGGKLARLTHYARQGTYLGQFNLALGCYRLVGRDARYAAEHKAISDALHAALVERKGRPLHSYPALSWTFDTIPCLLSLKLYDLGTGRPRSGPAIARHLKWLAEHATDPATKLPYSRVNMVTGRGLTTSRGCEVSWRIALLADLDEPLAQRTYRQYVEAFWLDRRMLAGFAEWPYGRAGRQDIDSGPIVMGIGTAASAFGIAAARTAGDTVRLQRLCEQAANTKTLLRLLIARTPSAARRYTLGGKIDLAGDDYTGFLFGDACLFYAVTWRRLCPAAAPPAPARRAGEP